MIRQPILHIPFIILFFFSISCAIDTLTPSHSLSYGETIISANGTFTLGFFTPPKTTNRYIGIWYNNIAVQTVVWVANRRNPIPNLNATLLLAADDASLHLITSGNSNPIWSSPSFPNSFPNPIAQLLDTGNFVVKSPNSSIILWQSFDHPTDTMLPGMKIGPNLRTGIDRNLTAWLSPSDPSPGNYTLAIDPIGVPQMVTRIAYDNWLWRGGPWNGYGFTGVGPSQNFNIELNGRLIPVFNSTPDEIYYLFSTIGGAIFTLGIDQNGELRRNVRQASSHMWSLVLSSPLDPCDFFAACGINSVCDSASSPICRCLDGFDPRNEASWGSGNWSDGCVRVSALTCEANGTDEFSVLRGAKLPDTTEAAEDMSLDLNQCKVKCLMNCSCKAYANAYFTGGGIGCIVWTADIKDIKVYGSGGQDLYVRVARIRDGSKKKPWIFAVTAVAVVLFLVIILFCAFMKWRRRHKGEEQQISSINWADEIMHKIEAGKEGNSEISFFKLTVVVNATNNFSDINKLGEGGFGPVYKGKLADGRDVAIKRLSAGSGQGLEEFKNEILLIAKLQHRNLVRLLGYCICGEEKMLIYEFMPNKSLDLFLFDVEKRLKLNWRRRYQIIEGIAEGLLYLHKHSRLRIIHRDLKASNILLDSDMNPKISDFGMARIFDSTDETTQANTRRIVGTYGYMSPEYALNGIFSIKSDVYSFGVLLLEIVSGKRSYGFREYGSWDTLLAYAWGMWNEGKWMEFVDPTLDNKFRHGDVARCIYVALLCVQERPEGRPVMSDVITMLSNENLCFNLIKEPAFFTMNNNTSDFKWPLNPHVNISHNDLSISTLSGR